MRLLVLGLDGATFVSLRPWMDQGHLPALQALMRRGVSADLRSTTPPVTAPAWVSCFSGVNPGRHGIFNFVQPVGTFGRLKVNSSRDVRVPRLWHRLSDAGLKVCVVDVPMTFPPEPVRGCMVSDLMVSGSSGSRTWPPELQQQLESEVGAELGWAIGDGLGVTRPYLEHLARSLEQKRRLDLWLMRQQQPEVFITVAQHTDVLAHYFWHVWDTTHPFHDPAQAAELQPALEGVLQALDAYVAALLEEAGPHCQVAVVSDHGFGPVWRRVYPNALLEGWGLLQLSPLERLKLRAAQRGLNREALVAQVRRLDRWGLLSRLRLATARRLFRQLESLAPRPDPTGSRAVFVHGLSPGIHVSQQGLQEAGFVEALKERLRAVRDETGQAVFEQVLSREEVYHGPELGLAPEIVFQLAPGSVASPELIGGPPLRDALPGQVSGFHRPEGVFMLAGEGIRTDAWLAPLSIQDVTPTLLQALGLPVPGGLDGRVAAAAFVQPLAPVNSDAQPLPPSPLKSPPESPQPSFSNVGSSPTAHFSPEEEALIRSRLEALGYL